MKKKKLLLVNIPEYSVQRNPVNSVHPNPG